MLVPHVACCVHVAMLSSHVACVTISFMVHVDVVHVACCACCNVLNVLCMLHHAVLMLFLLLLAMHVVMLCVLTHAVANKLSYDYCMLSCLYCVSQIGDVRTNFSMPDVLSIPLGGGTLVQYDSSVRNCLPCMHGIGSTVTFLLQNHSVTVGPNSVEYRIKQEALCFGGGTCTATDVAIAAGIVPQGIGTIVPALAPQVVYAAMREMKAKLEAAIDSMKVSVVMMLN